MYTSDFTECKKQQNHINSLFLFYSGALGPLQAEENNSGINFHPKNPLGRNLFSE